MTLQLKQWETYQLTKLFIKDKIQCKKNFMLEIKNVQKRENTFLTDQIGR